MLIFGGLIVVTWLAYRFGAGQVLTFWIAYVLTRPPGASFGDLLTQAREFGGLALGASVTSNLFFATILVLVAREQVLAGRHGLAANGAGPIGGRRRDCAWALSGVAAVAVAGWGVKDLEVAWDDAEAGLKPRDAAKWHQLDRQIDALLSALRASHPAQADCAAEVTTLMSTLNKVDGA